MTDDHTLDQLVLKVADATVALPLFEREDWQKAVFLNGLLAQQRDDLDAMCRQIVDRVVATQTTAGQFAYGSMDRAFQMRMRGVASAQQGWWSGMADERFIPQTNTAALGMAVLDWYERTNDEAYLEGSRLQYECLIGGNRTSDGTITQYGGSPLVFVDAIYMICPFLARYGRVAGDADATAESIRQFRQHRSHLLVERTGLYRHVWCERPDFFPQSAHWARGNGWVVAALADVVAELPSGHPDASDLVDALTALVAALEPLQDRSGMWHNILDNPNSWIETSGTALIVYGVEKAIAAGSLDDRFAAMAARGRQALVGAVDLNGHVTGVAGVPGGQEVLPDVNPTGQGAWLLAMAGRLR